VSNLKDCMGLIIKFERIKVNLIKRRFDLIFFKAEVHENKRELNYERERERVRYQLHHNSHNNG
jgi:hypothetical protein